MKKIKFLTDCQGNHVTLTFPSVNFFTLWNFFFNHVNKLSLLFLRLIMIHKVEINLFIDEF